MGCEAIHPETGQQCRVRGVNHARHVAGYYPDQVDWENEDFVRNTRVEVDRPASRLNSIAHQVQQQRRVDRNVVAVRHDARQTSREAAAKALPRSGSFRREVYDYLLSLGETGATDFELEEAFSRTHQSVSGCRRGLVIDHLVEDSGLKRVNERDNRVIVWIAVRL